MQHGLFLTATWTLASRTPRAIDQVMDRFRAQLPSELGPFAIVRVEDFRAGTDLPATDLLQLELAGDARLSIRPSGTESKLKVYAEVVAPVVDAAAYDTVVAASRLQLEELRTAILPALEALMPD